MHYYKEHEVSYDGKVGKKAKPMSALEYLKYIASLPQGRAGLKYIALVEELERLHKRINDLENKETIIQ